MWHVGGWLWHLDQHPPFKKLWNQSLISCLLAVAVAIGCSGPPQLPSLAEEGPALLMLSFGSTGNFGTVPNTIDTEITVEITNLSFLADATNITISEGLAAPFTFAGGAYPGTAGTCGSTLNPGARCTLVVSINPPATNTYNEQITISYNDSIEDQVFNIEFTAQSRDPFPASLSVVESNPFDFGNHLNGSVITQAFTLQNTGDLPATTIAAMGLSNPFRYANTGVFPGNGGNCGATLAGGSTCTFAVEYFPSVDGPDADSTDFTYNDGTGPQAFSMNYTGSSFSADPAELVISDAPTYSYGNPAVGSQNDKVFTITNTGDTDATVITAAPLTLPFSYADGTFPGTGGNCGATLSPAASCFVVIRFSPTTTNLEAETITLNYFDGTAAQVATRPIDGQGRIAANLTVVEGTNFDFGIVNNGFFVDQTLTIQNIGGEPATALNFVGLSAPYSFVDGTYPGTGGDCGATLGVAGTCTINIRFQPTATNTFNQAPALQYNDSFILQAINFNLTGIGFASALTVTRTNPAITPNTIDTPTVQIGSLINGLTVYLYRTAACGILESNLPATGATLDFMPTLAEGVYQFHARVEDDHGNMSPCSAASDTYQYDNTNPDPATNVVLLADFTTSATATPTFNWTASPSGDVVDYEVGLSVNAAGGNDIAGWTSKGVVTSASMTSGFTLTECQDLYASVRAIDHVNLPSTVAASATTFRYDSAIPTTPTVVNIDGDATTTNSATTYWNASTDACGIDHYEIAISADTNANLMLDPGEVGNVVPFKDVGLVTTHRENGLALATATNHYTVVRAIDSTGRISNESASDPYIVYNPSVELPDMIVWLDSADQTTLLDSASRDATDPFFNGTVRRWVDKSGSAVDHDFTTTSGNADAFFDALNFYLQFDGANTGYTTPDHPEINNATVTQRNITVAFRTSADTASRQVVYEEGGNIRGMNIYVEGGQLVCGFYNTPAGDGDGVQNYTHVATAIAANTIYFVTWVFDYTNYAGPAGPDGNLDCYVNNVHIGNVPTTSRLFAHSGNVGLGHRDNDSCYIGDVCTGGNGDEFLGDIFEVMLFNNAPTGVDVDNVHTYLDNKWN